MARQIATKVEVTSVDVDGLHYPPQAYLVLDGVAHEVTRMSAPGHISQSHAAKSGTSPLVLGSTAVEVETRSLDDVRSRLVAYLPGTSVQVGYADVSAHAVAR